MNVNVSFLSLYCIDNGNYIVTHKVTDWVSSCGGLGKRTPASSLLHVELHFLPFGPVLDETG